MQGCPTTEQIDDSAPNLAALLEVAALIEGVRLAVDTPLRNLKAPWCFHVFMQHHMPHVFQHTHSYLT